MSWVRARLSLFAVAVLALAGCKKHPTLEGFSCGGVAGYRCPAGSTCGQCQGADCIAGCYASTTCDPASPKCPGGWECNAASKHCLPQKVCDTDASCPSGQACVTNFASKGICTPNASK